MRKLKFRAWDSRKKIMGYSDKDTRFDFDESGVYIVNSNDQDFEDPIIMQFTGLKDKKRTKEYPEGQEIYEGDLVIKDHSYGSRTVPEVVEWNEYRAGWSVFSKKHLEVIGNIYENPELLK